MSASTEMNVTSKMSINLLTIRLIHAVDHYVTLRFGKSLRNGVLSRW